MTSVTSSCPHCCGCDEDCWCDTVDATIVYTSFTDLTPLDDTDFPCPDWPGDTGTFIWNAPASPPITDINYYLWRVASSDDSHYYLRYNAGTSTWEYSVNRQTAFDAWTPVDSAVDNEDCTWTLTWSNNHYTHIDEGCIANYTITATVYHCDGVCTPAEDAPAPLRLPPGVEPIRAASRSPRRRRGNPIVPITLDPPYDYEAFRP